MVQYMPAPIEREKRQLPSLEEIQANRKIAEAMMREGSDYSPVGHWTQGAARVAQALVGSMRDKQARDQQNGLQADANSALMGLYKPQSVTGGMPPVPASAMQPQPQMSPEEAGVAKFAQPNLMQGRVAQALDPSLVQAVKGFEGYTPKASWDYKQHSVGYGTRAQSPGEQISQPEAEQRLNVELSKAASLVGAFAPDAPEGVKKALTSLTFNAGNKWMDSGLGQAVKAGNWPEAQRIFMQYNKAGGQTLPGLVNRRQQEAQWFNQQPGQSMALGGPQQATQPQMAGQPQQLPQTADASQGQGLDRETIARMLANPLTRDAAQKLLLQQADPNAGLENAIKRAQLDKLRGTGALPNDAQEYEYFKQLPQPEQDLYLKRKRALPGVGVAGDLMYQKDTGQTVRNIGDNLFGAELAKGRGDTQAKGEAGFPKAVAAYEMAGLQDQFVIDDIKKAMSAAGPWTTGFTGNVASYIKGTPSSDLGYMLEGIKANLAFDKLQAIRDASPTGGALGAVSERELSLLESAWGSVAQAQSEAQFKERLGRLITIKTEYAAKRKQAYAMDVAKFGKGAVPNVDGGGQPATDNNPYKSKYGLD